MYQCTICDGLLEPHECRVTHSEELCEIYVNCPHCGSDCVDYEEEEDSE